MNDLELVRELGEDARLLTLSELSPSRDALASGIASYSAGKRRGPAPRRVVVTAAAAAVAAIVAGVVVGTHSSVRVPGHVVRPRGATVQLTAKQVLDRAARAALSEATVVPRGDQFVFTKVAGGPPGAPVTETWLSVDGSRDGLGIEAEPDGKVLYRNTVFACANGGPPAGVPCTPSRAYFPDMPTTAGAMGAYLEKAQRVRAGDLNNLSKTVGAMLASDYILPAQRAALYEYLATTPGLVVEHNVRDISGRPGVGVGWPYEGGKAMNIFDPETYAYLGITTWGIQGERGGDALIQVAIVGRPGQLPPGS
jgi:hypothetical protein